MGWLNGLGQQPLYQQRRDPRSPGTNLSLFANGQLTTTQGWTGSLHDVHALLYRLCCTNQQPVRANNIFVSFLLIASATWFAVTRRSMQFLNKPLTLVAVLGAAVAVVGAFFKTSWPAGLISSLSSLPQVPLLTLLLGEALQRTITKPSCCDA